MAQMPGTAGSSRLRARPSNDIYTVLVSIAMAIVLGTIGFVIYRSMELFDSPFPGFMG